MAVINRGEGILLQTVDNLKQHDQSEQKYSLGNDYAVESCFYKFFNFFSFKLYFDVFIDRFLYAVIKNKF